MKLFLLFIIGSVFTPILCQCQPSKATVFGYMEDSLTGERLIGATLSLPYSTGSPQFSTNSFGYFSVNYSGYDTIALLCSHIGYETKKVIIDPINTKSMIIKLVPAVVQEEEVFVNSHPNQITTRQIGQLKLSSNLIKKMPKFLGDNDPLKAIQTLPGITQGMEGTSGLIVRGGSPDQTLFLLDGIPIYNPSHLGGIFSPFNGDAIKDVTVYKGNFPARFGERLSSVIDLATKDGNMKKFAGEGSVGMLAAKVLLEGPIQKDKSSFMISARRTYWDLLASPFVAATNNDEEKRKLNLFFYDVNAKVNYIISPKNRLYASFFNSTDNYKFRTFTNLKEYAYKEENAARIGWQNMSGSVRWNHVFSSRMFVNTTLYSTNYEMRTDFYNNSFTQNVRTIESGKYRSRVNDAGMKTDFEYNLDNSNALRFGFATSYKQFRPGSSSRKTTTDGVVTNNNLTVNKSQSAPELAIYAEDQMAFSDKFNVNLGLRASAFKTNPTWHKSLEPRVSFNYMPTSRLRISGAYAEMNQYIHLLANNSVTLPTDIWVPATSSIKPMLARQFSLGVNTRLTDKDLDLGVEVYYKSFLGIAEYLDGQSYLSTAVKNWEQIVETGKGQAYGLELFLQKKLGRATGWTSYSFSRSQRQFPTINDGKRFPYKYDRPHTLNLVFMYHINKRWRFSANWLVQSGAPITISNATYKVINPEATPDIPFISGEYLNGRNDFRLLDYHRLDVSFTWSKKKRAFEKFWDFSFYNLYNRKNPMIYTVEQDYLSNAKSLKGTGFFPFMPSISYGFTF